jgi:hypothetical protein
LIINTRRNRDTIPVKLRGLPGKPKGSYGGGFTDSNKNLIEARTGRVRLSVAPFPLLLVPRFLLSLCSSYALHGSRTPAAFAIRRALIRVRPGEAGNRYERYREAWHLLGDCAG